MDDNWMMNKWAQVIQDVSDAPQNFKDKAASIVPLLDAGVDTLRDPKQVPNLDINKLMTLAWRLIGNKITPVSITEKMPFGHPETLHFWAEIKKDGDAIAFIIVPWEWDKHCVEDHFMQLGGLVFTASQCADYIHGRLQEGASVINRARAYEAEFLFLTKTGFTPNDYQKQVMKHYPLGLRSLKPAERYELTPYKADDFKTLESGSMVGGPNG